MLRKVRVCLIEFFLFSSRRRHTRSLRDWSSDVCSSDLDAMKAGIEAFLEECLKPELRQIALHDAPAVLGWERWREIGAANGLGLIEASLGAAIEAGEIRPLPVQQTAHLLMGALDEAAMVLARDERPQARAEVTEVL